jgi:phenylacetate-coenzyme A ligase PaaK-like adenylate-forming protein
VKITPLEEWIAGHVGVNGSDLNRERIEDYQLGMLRETIDWAKTRSPFYREHLARNSARDIVCREDLAKLPFTTAEDIGRRPFGFLCVSQSEVSRVVTIQTSGTTGEPKRIFFTSDDQERTIDFFHYGMSALVGSGDRVLVLFPGDLPGSVGDLLVKGLKRLGAVGIPHGPVRDPFQTLDVMERESIQTLVGVPTQVLGLARMSGGKAAPRNVLLSADHVPDAVAKELRRIWGCEVFSHYGMTEMGFGGGVECEGHEGYHLREADLYIEIVDPVTGHPVPEGELGEVAFTTLGRHGMPLIRYRTGDLSRFLRKPCPCGTVLMTLERVKNRLRSIRFLTSGGSMSMADLDEAIFPIEGVLDFSASLNCEQTMDWLRIRVQAADLDCGNTIAAVEEAVNGLPVIRSAVSAGTLALSVSLLPEGQPIPMGTAKRAIQCRHHEVV